MKLDSKILNRKLNLYTYYYADQVANGWLNHIATHRGSTVSYPFQVSVSLSEVVDRGSRVITSVSSSVEYLQVCGDYLIFVDTNGKPTGKRLLDKIVLIEEIK